MSTLVFSVDIFAGRTDLADVPSIGFVGGDYLWSTADCQGHKTGIIDQERISSFGAQCNITYGGEVSTPTSELTISALSTELLEHITQNGVRLVGKKLRIAESVDGGSYTVQRLALIETIDYTSNTSIKICTKQANLAGSIPLATAVVNESILMGVDGSANGSIITRNFGEQLNVPLTRFTNGQSPAFATTGIDAWVQKVGNDYVVHGLRDLEVGDDAVTTEGLIYSRAGNGAAKTKNELFVQGIWNNPDNANDFTRILLNHNGDSSWVVGVMPQFVGGILRVVRGGAVGDTYSITSVETKTYDGLYGTWVVLNKRLGDGEMVASGPEDITENSNTDPYVSSLRAPKLFADVSTIVDMGVANTALAGQRRLRQAYVGETASPTSPVTVVVLGYPSNIYMAPITPDAIVSAIIGVTSGSKNVQVSIPTESIRSVLQDDQYALLQIVPHPGSTSENQDSIIVGTKEFYKSFIDNSPQGDARETCTLWSEGSQPFASNTPAMQHNSVLANNTQLSSNWLTIHEVLSGINQTWNAAWVGHAMTSVYTRIDTEGDLTTLSPSSDSVASVYPLISLKCITDANWTASMAFTLNIRCHVISETGICLGFKEIFFGEDATGHNVTAQGEYLGGSFQIDYVNNDHTNGTEMLRKRIESGLDVREFCMGATGDSAKYLYTQVVVGGIFIDNQSLPTGPTAWTVQMKAQGVGMGVSVNKSDLKAVVTSNVSYPITNPVDLLKQVIQASPGAMIDSVAFAAVSASVESKLLPHGGNSSAFYSASGDTVESIISKIAKGSGLGVITNRDLTMTPRWFIDDYRDNKTPVATIGHADIVDGTLRVSRPGAGFMCTDYAFEIKGVSGTHTLNVNTGSATSYPTKFQWTTSAHVPDYQCQITDIVEHGQDRITVSITPVASVSVLRPPFISGMYYLVRTQTAADYGTICKMLGMYYNNGWKLLFSKVGMLDGGPLQDLSAHAWLSNISTMRQQPEWRYLVTSNIESDFYLIGKNLWEIASRARDYTGTVIQFPPDYAKIEQPLWTTSEGWTNFLLYCVAHTGYAKTLIEFECPINSKTSPLFLLDYIKIEAGPYLTKPTFGWIVSWDINPAKGTYTLKVLTAVSDEDTLYLDENHTLGLNAQMVIDETVTGSIIDEGVI